MTITAAGLTWTPKDLREIGGASEIQISTMRGNGSLSSPLPIWVVRVGDALFVRSYHGPDGRWFRRVLAHPQATISGAGRDITVRLVRDADASRTDIDEAYRSKYGSGGFGAAMTTSSAADTTLRLEPVNRPS